MQPETSPQEASWKGSLKGPPSTWPTEIRRGMPWRVSATVVLLTAWMAFILLYAFVWSGPYDLFQDIVIFIVSLVVLAGGIAGVWASWGMRFAGTGWEH